MTNRWRRDGHRPRGERSLNWNALRIFRPRERNMYAMWKSPSTAVVNIGRSTLAGRFHLNENIIDYVALLMLNNRWMIKANQYPKTKSAFRQDYQLNDNLHPVKNRLKTIWVRGENWWRWKQQQCGGWRVCVFVREKWRVRGVTSFWGEANFHCTIWCRMQIHFEQWTGDTLFLIFTLIKIPIFISRNHYRYHHPTVAFFNLIHLNIFSAFYFILICIFGHWILSFRRWRVNDFLNLFIFPQNWNQTNHFELYYSNFRSHITLFPLYLSLK